jgi:hypothetical protein
MKCLSYPVGTHTPENLKRGDWLRGLSRWQCKTEISLKEVIYEVVELILLSQYIVQ